VVTKPPRILGIDPGTRFLGWGVVERRGTALVSLGHGVLRAREREPLPTRLRTLAAGLREVIATHEPTEVAIEDAFYGRDPRAALRLGEGRGMILLLAAEADLAITSYTNNVVKRAVAGGGRASKERVRHMVVRLLGLETAPEPLDVSDALAMAICHLQRHALPGLGDTGLAPRVADAIRRARAGDRRTARRAKPQDGLPPRG
jgi:crossover junction endodeoxyribonuclease RuvC